jgi:DNA polymerase bacteriophage-type
VSTLSIDFETRATINLLDTELYRYAQHPGTDIWCMAWAFDDEEPEIWRPGQPLPQRVIDHIAAGGEIRAWNAQFERVIWNHIMVPRYGAPAVQLEQWVCSAAEAAAMALPRALGKCAAVTGVQAQKDDAGHRLMLQMTRPRRMEPDGTPVWWDQPDKIARLEAYCLQDVRTERALVKVLRRLVPSERETWLLDQRINDRGVPMDRALVLACEDIAREAVARANVELLGLSGGDIPKVSNHAATKQWLMKQGVATESVDRKAVRDLLTTELPPEARRVLEIRAEAGASSVAKLRKMLDSACDDDMLRGMLMYHGANTGRWGGRGVQPQNFPRGTVENAEQFIDLVLARDLDQLDLLAPPVMVVSSLLRACMIAGEEHDLLAADYSAIEARVLNALAGQDDVLDSFRAYDAGDKTKDPYIQNAMRFYGLPFEGVKKFPHRQLGKAQELGCGYQMGGKKFKTAAKDTYGLIVEQDEADAAVKAYRDTHPKVVQFWWALDDAAIEAVAEPGRVVAVGQLKFVKKGAYLYLVLPSGRPLVYAAPKLVDRKTPWGEMKTAVEISCEDSMTRQWVRYPMYGGIWAENVTQAVSRDLMVHGMKNLEAAGYPVVLTVHDEVVARVPMDFGSVEDFEHLLVLAPAWAKGWPLKAEGWRGERYRK